MSSSDGLLVDWSRTTLVRHASTQHLVRNLTNFVVFQVVWFACVIGARDGQPWLGVWVGAALLPLNLIFVTRGERRAEVGMWLAVGALGLVLDSGLLGLGMIDFPLVARTGLGPLGDLVVPPWIVVLWISVGSILRASLSWLHRRLPLACVLGAVGGPLSFWSGVRLGATEMPAGWRSVAALGAEYGLVFPILLAIARDGLTPCSSDEEVAPITPEGTTLPEQPAQRSDAP